MRLRFNFRDGRTDSALDASSTSLSSFEFQEFPEVSSPDHICIVLDPTKEAGEPEIVWIVQHQAGSSDVTIIRGQENSVAREHVADTIWVHGVLASDFEELTGPQGPPGPDFRHVHTQETPQAIWEIQHDLGGFPNITVVDSAKSVVEGHMVYIDENQVRLYFSGAFAGKVYLS